MLGHLHQVNFSALRLLPLNHDTYNSPEEERTILAIKTILRNACLLHYYMDLGAVQHYCDGKWTGEYRRINQMLRVMSHILLDNLFQELSAAMVDRVPNLLNTELPSKEVSSLLSADNLPTVTKNPKLVDKTILKEERKHILMIFRKHLAYFTPNLGLIKLGILDK